jgi:hypothetical protein
MIKSVATIVSTDRQKREEKRLKGNDIHNWHLIGK